MDNSDGRNKEMDLKLYKRVLENVSILNRIEGDIGEIKAGHKDLVIMFNELKKEIVGGMNGKRYVGVVERVENIEKKVERIESKSTAKTDETWKQMSWQKKLTIASAATALFGNNIWELLLKLSQMISKLEPILQSLANK